MKKIYFLLMIISGIMAIWGAVIGDIIFVMLMTLLTVSNANFYFDEREKKWDFLNGLEYFYKAADVLSASTITNIGMTRDFAHAGR